MSVPGSSREWVPAVSVQSENTKASGLRYLPRRTVQVGLHDARGLFPASEEILSLDRCETVEALLLVKSTSERP